MKRAFSLLLCAVLLLVCLSPVSRADFGDYSGDSDYGGSYDSYDYGSSYSYGSSYDYDSGYSYGGSSSDSGIEIAIILIVVIVLIGRAVFKSSGSQNTSRPAARRPQNVYGTTPSSRTDLRHMMTYAEVDPKFSSTALCQKLSNVYIRLQDAWEAKDLTPVRPYLTDTLYWQYDRQLNQYRDSHTTNVTERISVLDVTLSGWKQEQDNDVIVARLKTRLVDYVQDDNTGSLVRGSRTAEKFMEYEYTLTRKHGIVTGSAEENVTNCPNCGAVVHLNQSATCEYCDSVITALPADWVISGIQAISQYTGN